MHFPLSSIFLSLCKQKNSVHSFSKTEIYKHIASRKFGDLIFFWGVTGTLALSQASLAMRSFLLVTLWTEALQWKRAAVTVKRQLNYRKKCSCHRKVAIQSFQLVRFLSEEVILGHLQI
jgi:hypothetical protein